MRQKLSILLPILTGKKERVQDSMMIELQATKKIYQQTLVTERYKLVLYRDQDWGELYDLQSDPDQYSNLWNRPGYAALQMELLQRFVQFEMKKEGHVHDRVSFG